MPDYTENLNLAKPVPGTDVADITVLNENMDKIDEWSKDINAKTREATTVIPGIVKFGDDTSTALEGHRMAQIQGVEKFGGDVQIAGTKKVGYAYWCTVNKDMYICKVENSLNYIDASYFEAFSNNALLGKLNNLDVLIDEKLKNLCPIAVGALLILDSIAHPATLYPNTTWMKIEERFLYASAIPGSIGGSKKISIDNLEPFTPEAFQEAHIHTQQPHNHISNYRGTTSTSGSSYPTGSGKGEAIYTSNAGGEITGEAQPKITVEELGKGEDYMPPYYTVCMWKRLT